MRSDRTHRSLELPVPPDEAWDLLADDDARDQWFGGTSQLDVAPGGHGVFTDPGGARRTAVVEEARPGHRLAWTWSDDDEPGAPSRVEFDLSPTPSGTRIDVTETSLSARASAARPAAVTKLATWRGPLLDLELRCLLRTAVTATAR